MTQVICRFKDSGGVALTGFVRVTADYVITDELAGVTTVPAFRDTTLVNGECTLNLANSDSDRVSYLFEVWQVVGDTIGKVWELRARVPSSIEPILLTDLAPTGLTRDTQDTSVLTVTRRILTDDSFWTRVKDGTLNFKGAYLHTKFYKRGDTVVRDGSSYISIFNGSQKDNDPLTSPSHWMLIAAKGEVAANLVGDDAPYNANTWLNILASPSKNTLRNVLETKAPIVAPAFTEARNATTWLQTDYSSAIPNTRWVTDKLGAERAITVASLDGRVNAIKPRMYTGATRPWGVTFTLFSNATRDLTKHLCGFVGSTSALDINTTITLLNTSNARRTLTLRYGVNGDTASTNSPDFYIHLDPNTYVTTNLYYRWSNLALNESTIFLLGQADVNFNINVAMVTMFTTVYPA